MYRNNVPFHFRKRTLHSHPSLSGPIFCIVSLWSKWRIQTRATLRTRWFIRNEWIGNEWIRNKWIRNEWIRNEWIGNEWIRSEWIRNEWIRNEWIRNEWIGNEWIRSEWIGNEWMISPLIWSLYRQVSVTAREDVPHFGPKLPNPSIFRKV